MLSQPELPQPQNGGQGLRLISRALLAEIACSHPWGSTSLSLAKASKSRMHAACIVCAVVLAFIYLPHPPAPTVGSSFARVTKLANCLGFGLCGAFPHVRRHTLQGGKSGSGRGCLRTFAHAVRTHTRTYAHAAVAFSGAPRAPTQLGQCTMQPYTALCELERQYLLDSTKLL